MLTNHDNGNFCLDIQNDHKPVLDKYISLKLGGKLNQEIDKEDCMLGFDANENIDGTPALEYEYYQFMRKRNFSSFINPKKIEKDMDNEDFSIHESLKNLDKFRNRSKKVIIAIFCCLILIGLAYNILKLISSQNVLKIGKIFE